MNEAFDDAMVEGWEILENAFDLPDPDDRHVIAAAVFGRADVIVTENVKDFPESALKRFRLEAIRTDDFLLDQFDLSPDHACRVIEEQAAALVKPPANLDDLLTRLAEAGVPQFASAVRGRLAGRDMESPGYSSGTRL